MGRPAPIYSILLPAFLLAALPARGQTSQQRTPRIKVEVGLVNVLASVLAPDGRPVLDLPESAFQISEEGVPQKIERFEAETDRPLDLALMIDTSMSEVQELKFEREAAAHFIRQVVRPGDRLAVFQFADSVEQLSNFSADVPALQAAARRMTPGAGTALYDAIALGSQAVEMKPAGRRRVIVLVTDAGETTSKSSFEEARRAAIASEALLYTILIRPVKTESGRNTAGEHALVTITDSTGGAMYFPDTLGQLDEMFDRIDRELRTQYLLGYYPKPKPPAQGYRHIELRVAGSNYALHYRKIYFTGGAAE